MINDLNKHKKSDTIKWIIVFTCIILLTAGLLVTVTNGFTDFGTFGTTQQEESTKTETPAPIPEQAPVTPSEAEVINTIQVVNSDLMMLSVGAPIATMDETEVVNSRATSGVGVTRSFRALTVIRRTGFLPIRPTICLSTGCASETTPFTTRRVISVKPS